LNSTDAKLQAVFLQLLSRARNSRRNIFLCSNYDKLLSKLPTSSRQQANSTYSQRLYGICKPIHIHMCPWSGFSSGEQS